MKKLIFVFLVFVAMAAQAQTNLQVHYDLGNGRKHFTSTLEMFKPDKWGDTFFFVDMDFNGGDEKHPSLAYMEIARVLKFWKGPLGVQLEYNGGLLLDKQVVNQFYREGYFINNAYLAGVDYAWHDKDFTKFLNLKLLYKNIQGLTQSSTFQITGVWNLNYLNNKLALSGFADFWRENSVNIFLTEPQIWYNVSENLSLGGEVEFGYNFGPVNGWKVCPAIGAKWKF